MHFLVFALTDRWEDLPDLLKPYDQNLEVESYNKGCDCFGTQARGAAFDATRDVAGEMIKRRTRLNEQARAKEQKIRASLSERQRQRVQGYLIGAFAQRLDDLSKQQEELLVQRAALKDQAESLTAQIVKLQRAYEVAHPQYRRPVPDCAECQGKGQVTSTLNPNGYWDFWSLGGRWAGRLDPDYDRDRDPRNYEVCTLCDPQGQRSWPIPKRPGGGAMKRLCNFCRGTKRKRRAKNAPHPPGDQMRADRVADLLEAGLIDTPYSLVSDSGWQLRTLSDDSGERAWRSTLVKALRANPEGIVSVIDIHC